MNASNVDRLET